MKANSSRSFNFIGRIISRSRDLTITKAFNDTYGGRAGTHDDMVLAIALAAWKAEQPKPSEPPRSRTFSKMYS